MEGICQMQCCLVQRQIVDCGPEVQNVARPRAFGMETPEYVFAKVDGKVPFPIPGRIVQRTRTSTLFVTSQAIQISEMGQDLLDRNLFAQVCVVHRSNHRLIDRRGRGTTLTLAAVTTFFPGRTSRVWPAAVFISLGTPGSSAGGIVEGASGPGS